MKNEILQTKQFENLNISTGVKKGLFAAAAAFCLITPEHSAKANFFSDIFDIFSSKQVTETQNSQLAAVSEVDKSDVKPVEAHETSSQNSITIGAKVEAVLFCDAEMNSCRTNDASKCAKEEYDNNGGCPVKTEMIDGIKTAIDY
jgi:hypothetical protein